MVEELVCAECSKSINPTDEYTITNQSNQGNVESVLCLQCREVYQTTFMQEQEIHAYNIPLALIAGLLGAAVAGLIWYYFVTLTEIQWGLVSMLMGWIVGKSMVFGSGNKGGKILQIMSLSLTIVAIIFSEYMILNHFFIEEFGDSYGNLTLSDFLTLFRHSFSEMSGYFNLLFYGIALWQAYVTPRKREFSGITKNRQFYSKYS